ncbi:MULTISPECIES: bacterial ammonia monooxygenase, subunit AmoA [Methylomonas]|jgi:methane/ammonia monooxygenase subunit A|uniref:Methane monooxygenase/ammonia monooxygenase subunit A n=1 Tax=Methylomonas methanica TaxID=421 RepID=A0A177MSQ7_METMH|nr:MULTISPECIES: bacterial ammonia monooxygenase, subunit AmoA [Methylomonas]OAI07208.1 methane monooxygenase/ammonia monooxygenase subunit A [Methylomonas methanica]OAI08303.1 methane monooxygenase/ammonia monooxygenase subunit A [Methylomonas methanica]
MSTISVSTGFDKETATVSRIYDYLILVLAGFLYIGSYHLHFMLTVGDWDFWLDWKDRQYWPLVTPVLMIAWPAAVQSVLWTHFRLPMGATLSVVGLMLGMWITRVTAYQIWTNYPLNFVLPATMIPSALVLDAILMLSPSFLVTAIAGGASFALLFYPTNWPIFAMFHVPIEWQGGLQTIADQFGFEYLRAGMPEYLRIIERGTLRTYGQMAAPLSAFFAALLCILVYAAGWYIGKAFATVRYLKRV